MLCTDSKRLEWIFKSIMLKSMFKIVKKRFASYLIASQHMKILNTKHGFILEDSFFLYDRVIL